MDKGKRRNILGRKRKKTESSEDVGYDDPSLDEVINTVEEDSTLVSGSRKSRPKIVCGLSLCGGEIRRLYGCPAERFATSFRLTHQECRHPVRTF